MQRKERFENLLQYFEEKFPEVNTELSYHTSFELLVAVILSAQCTDKRVNMVTPALFAQYPTAELLAKATFNEVFALIKSISYPNNKAKHLIAMAQMLVKDFNSEVPNTMEDLQKLPGVGRKTANVILSVVYQQPAMAVDTHVFRVSKRLGLVNQNLKTPLEVEKALLRYIPKEKVAKAHHWLILHGRYVCTARSPQCTTCQLQKWCKMYAKKVK